MESQESWRRSGRIFPRREQDGKNEQNRHSVQYRKVHLLRFPVSGRRPSDRRPAVRTKAGPLDKLVTARLTAHHSQIRLIAHGHVKKLMADGVWLLTARPQKLFHTPFSLVHERQSARMDL